MGRTAKTQQRRQQALIEREGSSFSQASFDGSSTDVTKSLEENYEQKKRHWKAITDLKQDVDDKIACLARELAAVPNSQGRNRIKKAEIRGKMKDLEEKSRQLSQISEGEKMIEYLKCVSKVLLSPETDAEEPGAEREKKPGEGYCMVQTTGSIKPKFKKKLLPNQKPLASRANVVSLKPIASYVSMNGGSRTRQCKQLAQLLKEKPLDVSEHEYCPQCPGNVIMECVDKPPSMCCPSCSLSRPFLDIYSMAVHDKEMPVHMPFTYKPKQHFVSWVRRIAGKQRLVIPPRIVDGVRLELYRRGIEDLNLVTWFLVKAVVKYLGTKKDKEYKDYYPHVYQITNIIRGHPVLVLTDSQEQELFNMFDIIHQSWEKHKEDERSNFMASALVLQLCFYILGYPHHIIAMFNPLKGKDNLDTYDRLIEKICLDIGWTPVKTAVMSGSVFGNTGNIFDAMRQKRARELTVAQGARPADAQGARPADAQGARPADAQGSHVPADSLSEGARKRKFSADGP